MNFEPDICGIPPDHPRSKPIVNDIDHFTHWVDNCRDVFAQDEEQE